jgi:hypothetical protein
MESSLNSRHISKLDRRLRTGCVDAALRTKSGTCLFPVFIKGCKKRGLLFDFSSGIPIIFMPSGLGTIIVLLYRVAGKDATFALCGRRAIRAEREFVAEAFCIALNRNVSFIQ